MKASTFAIITGAALSVASVGLAYPYPELYEADAAGPRTLRIGGAGIYGTGGKTDYKIECADCHVAGSTVPYGFVTAEISVVSPAPVTVGGEPAYVPGTRYEIRVELKNEHTTATGHNGFAATVENDAGQRMGVLEADGVGCAATSSANCQPANRQCRTDGNAATTSLIHGSCKAVVNQDDADKKKNTAWTFFWTAPSAGAGTATIYAGVVDGGGAIAPADLSSLEDDTANTTLVLLEGS